MGVFIVTFFSPNKIPEIAGYNYINCQQQYVPHIRRLRIIKTEYTHVKANEHDGK